MQISVSIAGGCDQVHCPDLGGGGGGGVIIAGCLMHNKGGGGGGGDLIGHGKWKIVLFYMYL